MKFIKGEEILIIIPAVDIKNGKCVRLVKGDPKYETIYSDDPLKMAKIWEEKGAQVLHIVDLDGALGKKKTNERIIHKIINELSIKVQVGGGIRSTEKAERFIDSGAEKIILGTLAIKKPEIVEKLSNQFGKEHIMVALDHKKGDVAIEGWKKKSEYNAFEFAKKIERLGAGWILFSSVESDGTLTGPDIKNTDMMIKSVKIPVIAAGGVGSLKDLLALKKINVPGVVVGKALYDQKFTLEEALKVSRGELTTKNT